MKLSEFAIKNNIDMTNKCPAYYGLQKCSARPFHCDGSKKSDCWERVIDCCDCVNDDCEDTTDPCKDCISSKIMSGFAPKNTTSDVNTNENVENPKHYTSGGIECIDLMRMIFGQKPVMWFCLCNAFKYIFRHTSKNGEEDVDKAGWYLKYYDTKISREMKTNKSRFIYLQLHNLRVAAKKGYENRRQKGDDQ